MDCTLFYLYKHWSHYKLRSHNPMIFMFCITLCTCSRSALELGASDEDTMLSPHWCTSYRILFYYCKLFLNYLTISEKLLGKFVFLTAAFNVVRGWPLGTSTVLLTSCTTPSWYSFVHISLPRWIKKIIDGEKSDRSKPKAFPMCSRIRFVAEKCV